MQIEHTILPGPCAQRLEDPGYGSRIDDDHAGDVYTLILTVINANRMINEDLEAHVQTHGMATSASLANDLLLEILSKKFDERSDLPGYVATGSFSDYQQAG